MTQTIGIDATYQAELARAMDDYGKELREAAMREGLHTDHGDVMWTIGLQYARDADTMRAAPQIGSGALIAVEKTVLDMAHSAMVDRVAAAAEDAQALRDQAFAKDFEAARLTLIMEKMGL